MFDYEDECAFDAFMVDEPVVVEDPAPLMFDENLFVAPVDDIKDMPIF